MSAAKLTRRERAAMELVLAVLRRDVRMSASDRRRVLDTERRRDHAFTLSGTTSRVSARTRSGRPKRRMNPAASWWS